MKTDETLEPTAADLLAEYHAWVRRMFWRGLILVGTIAVLLLIALGVNGIDAARGSGY